MELFIRANRISKYNMHMISENIRIPMALLVVMIYVMESLSNISLFSKAVNINITPYAFVFLINNYKIQFIIAACAIIIFGNAPYEDETFQYMVTRSGKISWGLGQIIYIGKIAFIYVACIVVASLIPYITHINLSNEWGKIWGTLGKTNAGSQYGIDLLISQNIMNNYKPISAFAISFMLEFCSIFWIGLIIYFGNKITNAAVGTIVGIIFSMFDICIANDWMDYAYMFSPMSLAQLDLYYGYAAKWGLNIEYTIKFFVVTLTILCILCIVANYKEKLRRRGCKNGR